MITTAGPAGGTQQLNSGDQMGTWTEHTAPDGRKYYYNATLKKSSWEKPAGVASQEPNAGLQQGQWEEHKAPDGRTYYYNKTTKESKWTLPAGIVPVKKIVGGGVQVRQPQSGGGYVCPPGAIKHGPTATYATIGEAKEAFVSLLRDAQFPSTMAWEQALGIISVDRRFGGYGTLHDRRQLFNEYIVGKRAEEEEAVKEKKEKVCLLLIVMTELLYALCCMYHIIDSDFGWLCSIGIASDVTLKLFTLKIDNLIWACPIVLT